MNLLKQLNEAGQKKYHIIKINKKTKKYVEVDVGTFQNIVYGLTEMNNIIKKMKEESKFDFKNFSYEVEDEDGYFIKKIK